MVTSQEIEKARKEKLRIKLDMLSKQLIKRKDTRKTEHEINELAKQNIYSKRYLRALMIKSEIKKRRIRNFLKAKQPSYKKVRRKKRFSISW